MILTCPACDTKYVVKDGAIPLAGRQVRCASCKHSWHQQPEPVAPEDALPRDDGAQPETKVQDAEREPEAISDSVDRVDRGMADAPLPPAAPPPVDDEHQWQPVEPVAAWDEPSSDPGAEPAAGDFEPFFDHEPIEQPKSKWPLLLLLVLAVALAAIAFWFLAPADLRARAGLASTDGSQLYVVLNNKNYQQLASGNTLFTVSGRIINATDARQTVPPIRAELLDESKQRIIYSWTIPPPVATLDLNKSAAFNNAEVGVPEGGVYIRLHFGGPA